jgi:ubiquinone/menaquinone biosynthesis C-methylase UbiE
MKASSITDRALASGRWPTGNLGTMTAWVDTTLEKLTPYFTHQARLLDLRPDDVFLDVACGTGVFLHRHAAHVHRVAGIDHSDTQIAMARRLLRDRLEAGTAELVEGDVTALPWPEETFTAVLCNCVDCFPDKQQQAFTEMHRVLRPGGRIVVSYNPFEPDPNTRPALMSTAGFTDITVARLPTLVMARRPQPAGN